MKNEIKDNALSYSKTGPKELWPSVSNYVLQLLPANGSPSPVALLYFMDSGGWFLSRIYIRNPSRMQLNEAVLCRIPEIIFWHIPTTAYKEVAPTSLPQSSCVGSINLESVAPQEAEMGVMKLLEGRPSVKVRKRHGNLV
ncbi:hypothetical protein C3L33_02218, partial [Rhododendron williamsianum]